MREAEFDLTIDLPCSAGILVYDLEIRVTVQYSVEAGSADWALTTVRLDGQPGTIRKGDLLWPYFEQACTEKKTSQIITRECFDDHQLWPATVADAINDIRKDLAEIMGSA